MARVESAERVRALRAFSRCWTQALRVLDEGLVGTPYTLTEARVLFELAHDGSDPDCVDLRRRLDLDASYFSRIVARFEADGLVVRGRAPDDGRRRRITLTAAGRARADDLGARSDEQARRLLDGLAEHDQVRLVEALNTARGLLDATPRPSAAVVLRAPEPGDHGWVIERNAVLYAAEHGFGAGYEALVARIVAEFAAGADPARERAWIAEVGGERVGAVYCRARDATTAQLRLLLVEPTARGRGVGSALVEECVRFARTAGYTRITLWTTDVLTSARRIYEAAGFALDDAEAHHGFGRELVGQNWSLAL